MKTSLPGISSLDVGVVIELYTITLKNGAVIYLTTGDFDITRSSVVYLSGYLNLERSAISTTVGIAVDDVNVTIYRNADTAINGVLLPNFVNNGGFDGAQIKIERARNSYCVHLFEGYVSDVSQDRTKLTLTVSSPTHLLDVEMPRNSYTSSCIHRLFDIGCGISKATYANGNAVGTGSTATKLICPSQSLATGYFDLGTITFTSGANAGATRTIKKYTVGNFWLAYPLNYVPAAGDTFTAYPGCDKRVVNCNSYSNIVHFKGYPYIPTPEASL